MPNKYSDDNTSILLRMPKELKQSLYLAAEQLNKDNPGANYSANSIIRTAIVQYLDKLEQEQKINNKK